MAIQPRLATGPSNPFDEAVEMHLASELLEAVERGSVRPFFGSLSKAAGVDSSSLLGSPWGRALAQVVLWLIRKTLPNRASVSSRRSGPRTNRGVRAGWLLGLELEGLSPEDRDFEIARQIVRFAGVAIRTGLRSPESRSPEARAVAASMPAARRFAPGLLPRLRAYARRAPRSGRWRRRGRSVVLYGP
jgi:hypothetical protein